MERTLKVLKEAGLDYWIVERFIPGKPFGKRVDLFHIIDLLVLDSGIIGVQVCGTDFAAHKDKIMEEQKPNTIAWLRNGGRLEVWGWRKLKKVKGKKATYWSPRIADVLLINNELYFEVRK
jgi:hypothetical protein